MTYEHPSEQVVDHMVDELGERGRRAAELLATARGLLESGTALGPRVPDGIAYCLREATTSIIQIPRNAGRSALRGVVGPVIGALDLYESTTDVPAREAALRTLLERLPTLRDLHQSWVERDLIEGLIERTGAAPYAMRGELIHEIQEIRSGLNAGVHDRVELEAVIDLYGRLAAVLRRLFTPPIARNFELQALAASPDPTAADVLALRALLVSPQHMRTFLGSLAGPAWLHVLADDTLFDPPTENAPWAGYAAADALAATDLAAVVAWFGIMYGRCQANTTQAIQILRALQNLGDDARDLIVRIVGEHLVSRQVRELAWALVAHVEPGNQLVADLADLLLNDHSDDSWLVDEVAARLAAGVTQENAVARLSLLAYKLRNSPHDYALTFALERVGRLEDLVHSDHFDRRVAILSAVVAGAIRAENAVSSNEMLAIIDGLPQEVRARIRAWWLGRAPDVAIDVLADEATFAIGTREPTGDDITLLARITESGDHAALMGAWATALGPAPASERIEELFEGYGDERQRCVRAYRWLGILPAGIAPEWEPARQWLVGRYGAPTAESYTRPAQMPGFTGRSPFTVDDLASGTALEAAAMIAAWRPDPNDRMVGAEELAQALQIVVAAEPSRWLTEPVVVATTLREPIYIQAYLRGASEAVKSGAEVKVTELVALAELVFIDPWPAEPMGMRGWGAESWRYCHEAAVWFIQAMSVRDVEPESLRDRLWVLLERALRGDAALDDPSGSDLDSATFSLRPNALRTAVSLMSLDSRNHRPIPERATALLTDMLNPADPSAIAFRSVLGELLPYLRPMVPAWLDAHEQEIFAPADSPDLEGVALEAAFQRADPSSWLMKRRRHDVFEAARHDKQGALRYVLCAYLWRVGGYELGPVVLLLRSEQHLSSQLGETLGRLLRGVDDDAIVTTAVDLWQAILDPPSGPDLAGFGWMAEASGLANDIWLRLTLDTARRSTQGLEWASRVAERAAALPPSEATLALFDLLVRHPARGWASLQVHDIAARHLRDAAGLADAPYRRLQAALVERGHEQSGS